jgi:hypothetical protein
MSTPTTVTMPQAHTIKVFLLLTLGILFAIVLSACGTQAAPTSAAEVSNPPANAQAPAATSAPSEPTSAPAEAAATTAPAATGAISFAKDVLPVLQSRCVSCHGGERTSKGLNLNAYDSLMTGSQNGAVIVPGDASNSLLVQLIQNGKMPKRGPKLTPGELQALLDWINAGALNN